MTDPILSKDCRISVMLECIYSKSPIKTKQWRNGVPCGIKLTYFIRTKTHVSKFNYIQVRINPTPKMEGYSLCVVRLVCLSLPRPDGSVVSVSDS